MGKKSRSASTARRDIGIEITGLLLLAFTAFSLLGVYGEQSLALQGGDENPTGQVGSFIGSTLISYFGVVAAWFLLIALGALGACVLFRIQLSYPRTKLFAVFGLLFPTVALLEWSFAPGPLLGDAFPHSGGYFGSTIGRMLEGPLHKIGTRIVLINVLLIGLLLAFDLLISPFLRKLFGVTAKVSGHTWRALPGVIAFFRLPARTTPGAAPALPTAAAAATAVPGPRGVASDTLPEADGDDDEAEHHGADDDEDELHASDEALDEDDIEDEFEVEFEEEVEERRRLAAEAKRLGLIVPPDPEIDDEDDSADGDDMPQTGVHANGASANGTRGAAASPVEAGASGVDAAASAGAPVAAPRPERNIRVTHRSEAPKTFAASGADSGTELKFQEKQLSLDGVYNLPPMTLLDDPPPPAPDAGREELENVAIKIEQTLASFKIEARVENVLRGPVITQYEVSLAAGIKVHKIVSLSDDLAMALSAQSVRVVAPIPGKSAVGIEVPNRLRESVVPKELLLAREFTGRKFFIPILLGKDAAGSPIIEDLTRMPHLLIAGSTGSGKSVCINAIISSMLMTKTPDELKLILVDPKMVELSAYEEIPHLLTPVITDMKKAPAALDWLCRKMDDRYQLLSRAEVRNIADYNDLGKEQIFERLSKKTTHEEADQAPDRLPYIVIIIDELADLMMTASKEVEASIIRLSQKSRAVGIHVIVATQRPSVDVITGLIKANLPCRISFQVAGRVDSRTIIDRNGAEKLLGRGDMLFLAPGSSSVVRAQATYISDKEIKKIVRFLQKEKAPEFNTEILTYLEGQGEPGEDGEFGEPGEDDLFDEAVRIILESQRGSVSLLQRRLGIGYTRASRLMDIMGDHGIVGNFKGSKAREVLTTLEEWEASKNNN